MAEGVGRLQIWASNRVAGPAARTRRYECRCVAFGLVSKDRGETLKESSLDWDGWERCHRAPGCRVPAKGSATGPPRDVGSCGSQRGFQGSQKQAWPQAPWAFSGCPEEKTGEAGAKGVAKTQPPLLCTRPTPRSGPGLCPWSTIRRPWSVAVAQDGPGDSFFLLRKGTSSCYSEVSPCPGSLPPYLCPGPGTKDSSNPTIASRCMFTGPSCLPHALQGAGLHRAREFTV